MSKSPFATRGGVSPLNKGEEGSGSGKSKARKIRAGSGGKKSTNTKAQDKSGYQRSGGDFINVHSFTANTRLSPSLANTLGPSISGAVAGKTKQDDTKTDKTEIGKDASGNPIFLPDGYKVETKLIKGEKGKKGNEFADNCYNTDGSKKVGASYYSEIKGYDVACEWSSDPDYKPSNTFDYDKEDTEDSYKTVITDKNGVEIGGYDGEGNFTGSLEVEEAEDK